MSIETVKMMLNGTEYELVYNATHDRWQAEIPAPSVTSWNEPDHIYPVRMTAVNSWTRQTIIGRTDEVFGKILSLRVLEQVSPAADVTDPAPGERILTGDALFRVYAEDEHGGSGIDPQSLRVTVDGRPAIVNETAAVTGGYEFEVASDGQIGPGEHTVKVTVADNDGNVSEEVTATYFAEFSHGYFKSSVVVVHTVDQTASVSEESGIVRAYETDAVVYCE